MRSLYIVLAFVLAPFAALIAQPTLTIGNASACTGESFCVPVTTRDFTNINSLQFSVRYDATVLTFTGAQDFNPNLQIPNGNLGPALFTEATSGQISFSTWETGNCTNPSNIGVTLADGAKLYDLCFTAIGGYGEQSEIAFDNTPTSIRCTRNATLCNNIGIIPIPGEVTLCVREFNLTASNAAGNPGDQVCVDFTVEGFDGLSGAQFSVNYDPAALRFVNLFPNTEIPFNGAQAYGLPGQVGAGNITVAWVVSSQPNMITVEDGTTFFTACFEIIAACETSSQITFSDMPTSIEINNGDPANPTESSVVPASLNAGTVQVSDCSPTGIEININCGAPVNINDVVCVEFLAGTNFTAVRRLEYLMTWNPNILELVSVDDPNTLPNLTAAANFNSSNAANGVLGLEWALSAGLPTVTRPDGTLLYRVCFRVVGVGGDSPVQITVPGIGVSNNVNIGINPSNCVVRVNQPQSVLVSFGDIEAELNSSACMPVTVSNFNDVVALDFTMLWNELIWLYNGQINNINPLLTGAGIGNFTEVGASSLGFVWSNATGVTLPNNTVLFEVCFETAPTAIPGVCDELNTVGFPFPERAETVNSNGQNIGLLTDTAALCVLFPEGFGLEAVATSGGWLDTTCMVFNVESFDNITGADFAINWDPAQLAYVSSRPLGWTNIVLAPQPVGTLEGSYLAASPEPLPDGTAAFEVCFQLVGDPNDCYPVTIQTNSTPEAITTNGPGSIVQTNAEICVEEQIVIDSITIVAPSCPGACDGSVQISIREWAGQGFIGTTWQTQPFTQFTPLMLDDVCEGELIFTIFDNRSGVSLTDTINIVSEGILPTAVINGADERVLNCSDGQVLFTAENQGPGFSYAWYYNTINSTPFADQRQAFGTSSGTVILCVLSQVTGCTAYDTVQVVLPELPVAEVVPNSQGITCTTECVTVSAANVNPMLAYRWEIVNGNPALVDSATINTPNFIVCGPGRFRLIVTDPVTGCVNDVGDASDEVIVMDDRIFPSACINTGTDVDREQNCDGTPIVFDGSCSTNLGATVTYTWYPVNADGSFGTAAGNSLTNNFTELGMYALLVQETTSGCTDTAFASIIENSNAPSVTLAEPSAIDCNNTTTVLTASIMPNDPSFTVAWILTNGASLEPGTETSLVPTALTPGTYQVIITNPANQCEAEATVTVADQQQAPVAVINNTPENLLITCTNGGTLVLDGRDSEDGVNYQWYLGDLDSPVMGAVADTLSISVAGVYILQVTNPVTGCTADATVTVTSEDETPTVVLSQLEATLTCVDTTTTVTATVLNAADFIVDLWVGDSPEANASIVSISPNGLELTVNGPGVYTLRVESTLSGCVGEAEFVVTESLQVPNVGLTSDTLTINCANGEVTLSGAGSSMGQNFTYQWENLDGTGEVAEPTSIQTTTTIPGTYLFTVTNADNGCTADTLVRVGADLGAPTLNLPAVENLSCATPARTLRVEIADADNFLIAWSGTPTPMPADSPMPQVSAPGVYTVTVTNTDNGCQSTGTVTVGSDDDIPNISIATPAEFDCPTEFVLLDASATGNPDDFSLIEWQFGGGVIATGSFTLNAANPGEYTLNVVAAANGCPASQTVTVVPAANLTLPTIALNDVIAALNCDGAAVTIDASATGAADDFADITWSGTADFTEGANPFLITTTNLGSYTLTVTANSPLVGCTSTETFEVVLDANPTLPTIALNGAIGAFGCDRAPVVIDASATGVAADFASIVWDSSAPFTQDANPFIINAQDVGEYTLTVSLNDAIEACSTSETFVVEADVNTPVADAGADVSLDCGTTGALNAAASTPPSATFIYTWLTLSGAPLMTGIDGPAPTVSTAGTYQLIVTNVENGCADTSNVVAVTLVFPADADAGELVTTCDETAELNAVAVPGTTGVWTTSAAAVIEMNTDPASGVSSLPVGASTFTWTLSAPGCPDYSSDNVTVVRATGITANPDMLTMTSDQGSATINVLDNDVLSGQTELDVTVITAPAFGTFDTLAFAQGELIFSVQPAESGMTTLTYQVCSRVCPDLCAMATVNIDVRVGDDTFVPNTITPNGDGANDELIFDVLLFNPASEFPDNELIVFNRWGDIIYEAKPYNNDWTGVNQSNQPIAEGTYYYILRLNVGQGQIIRGDITVIR